MPLVSGSSDNEFAAMFQKTQKQLTKVMTQPTQVIANSQGQKILVLGMQAVLPGGSTPTKDEDVVWGLQLVNSSGKPVAMFGEQPGIADSASLTFYSPSGMPVMTIDEETISIKDTSGDEFIRIDANGINMNVVSLTDTGIIVDDNKNNPRVQMGLLPNGDHGLQVTNSLGVTQTVNPVYSFTDYNADIGTATSFTSFGVDTLSVPITASGKALVLVGANVAPNPNDSVIQLGLSIGGATPGYAFAQGQYLNSIMASQVLTGLTPGTVDFTIYYSTVGATGDGSMDYLNLTVWPL
jgi:hypothetical protein